MSGRCLRCGGLDERDARLSSGANPLGSRGAGSNSGGHSVGDHWSAGSSGSGLSLGSTGLDDWDTCLGGTRSCGAGLRGTGCGNGRRVLDAGFSRLRFSTAGLRGDDGGGFDGTLGDHCGHLAVVTSRLACVGSADCEGQSGHNVG